MSDNTVLNLGTGGDIIRDLNRQSLGTKTQVVALDFGGPAANAEVLITAGQQTMAASIPVVLAIDQAAIPVSASKANNNWGQALSIVNGSTATVVNIPSSPSGYHVNGFIAHGTGDGYFFLQIASTTVFSGRIRSTLPTLVVSLPNGITVATGSTVTFKVTNESGNTADYEATLLGS